MMSVLVADLDVRRKQQAARKDKNIFYNDAGKLIVDTNGRKKGVVTDSNSGGLNGQVLAFIDPVGPETEAFSGNWLSFFG